MVAVSDKSFKKKTESLLTKTPYIPADAAAGGDKRHKMFYANDPSITCIETFTDERIVDALDGASFLKLVMSAATSSKKVAQRVARNGMVESDVTQLVSSIEKQFGRSDTH